MTRTGWLDGTKLPKMVFVVTGAEIMTTDVTPIS